MKVRKKFLWNMLILSFLFLFSAAFAPKETAAAVPAEQTFTGYIQDQDCFIQYAPDYGSDTRGCLLMHACAASGYGITALQSDGTYKFYYLDGNFAVATPFTVGTGSQLAAWNLVQNTTKKDHVTIAVTGTLSGTTKVSPYDGISYPVITVSSLAETPTLTPVLSSIAITKPATKLTYTVGDPLDITGLEVTGTYSDTTTKAETITAANITGFDSSKPVADQVLTVTVGGKTVTYTINVNSSALANPPALTADTTNNTADQAVEIRFTDDAAWRGAITAVRDGAATLSSNQYSVAAGVIKINAGVLIIGTHAVTVLANGYNDAAISQIITGTSVGTSVEYIGVAATQTCSEENAADPAKITKSCLIAYEAEGYGIVVKQADGSYQYFKFDEAGNNLTKGIINTTAKDQNITIKVSGSIKDDVINVSSLVEYNADDQEFYGILIDQDCSGTNSPEQHTKSCNLMESCKASGYGIDVKQADGTYKFYKFDIPKGDKLAFDYLNNTTQENNITVVVRGVYSNNILKVTSIVRDYTQEYKGILIDAASSGIAAPETNTKENLLDPVKAASGYGIDVKQADGTYKFYKFDAAGHQLAKTNVLDTTAKTNNFTIIVRGELQNGILNVATIAEDLSVPAVKAYRGWIASAGNYADFIDYPTAGTLESLKATEASGYGIILTESNYSFKFYRFDSSGNTLIKNNFVDKTGKAVNLTVVANGWIDGNTFKLTSVEEEQELVGLAITKKLFDGSQNGNAAIVEAFTRDQIVAQESVDSGYGIAVKQNNGNYKFYLFDTAGHKSTKSVLSWYVSWGTNQTKIPILAQVVLNGDTVKSSRVLRERQISGRLGSLKVVNADKPLKDITSADLLTDESKASGYGYYVHSCGGHEFFKFDKESSQIVYDYVKNGGDLNAIPYGYYYWVGKRIKLNSIIADPNPDKPINEELSGVVATRSYYNGTEYQNNGVPGSIPKGFLQDAQNAASGYGILYKTCCRWGYLRFDKNGTNLIKTIIDNYTGSGNINVIVKGKRTDDYIEVTSIILQNDQNFQGILIDAASSGTGTPQAITKQYLLQLDPATAGYGVAVKRADGTYKFYKFDEIGYYYSQGGGQTLAKNILSKTTKPNNITVAVKGTLDGERLFVSSIAEDTNTAEQVFSGWLGDSDCSPNKSDPTTMSTQCLKCTKCVASGYGISLKQADGTYIYYKFDENGHNLAKNIVATTTCLKVPAIVVRGTLTGDIVTIDGKKYPVLKVSSLSEPSTLNSIAVTTPAAKLTYSVGDSLDITGLQVTGTYLDNTTALQAITAANITGFDSSKPAAAQVLTVTVDGKTTTYKVDILAASILNLKIVSSREIDLTWTAKVGAKSYNIYRAKSANGSFTKVGRTTALQFNDNSLKPSTTYWYKVKAVTTAGESEYSEVVQGTTKAAALSGIKAKTLSSTAIALSWKGTAGNTYNVYRSTDKTGKYTVIAEHTKNSAYTDQGLDPGTTYWYYVTAVNASGDESTASKLIGALTKVTGPSGLKASVISKSEIDLTWTAKVGAKSYKIYRATSVNGTYRKVGTSKTASYENTRLKAGTAYWYKVTVVTSAGEGDYSEVISATTLSFIK